MKDSVVEEKPQDLLGYRENGKKIMADSHADSLERYLLLNETSTFQRFSAKVFRFKVVLGTFRPAGEATGYMKYYLFWHSHCRTFAVAYVHGYSALPCWLCSRYRDKSKKELRKLGQYYFSQNERSILGVLIRRSPSLHQV